MLSHELRTPLTPVLAAASALVEFEGLPDQVRDTLAIVQRNVATEAQLIDDLLDLARLSHGKMRISKRPLDLHQAVHRAVETLSAELRAKQLQLGVDLTATEHWVSGDDTRLQQVFWNLLRNAIKFTPEAGQIAIRTWNSGCRVFAEVSDSGQGIKSAMLARLFEPFEQALDQDGVSNRGLGLGLPICRGILEQHEASIVASSPGPGKGSRFVVEFANVEAVAAPAAQPPSVPPPAAANLKRILLVEDHPDTAAIFEMLLTRDGYDVTVADSIQAALQVARDTFDLVLSDVGLPDGTGLDLIRALRKSGSVKGIALSGYGTEEHVRASKEAGFDAHLTKPVNFDELRQAIATLSRR